ncbi:DUF4845 domain-containing protein [Denitratisoma sp. DHT3]|uniref:DUF4845 domain-containing protein n=1 Tax=Denitratisoma sp. DHT3 TaxID=1981880 RepID=UPI001198AD1F|nr:DUF4845 domain-containing protein [Denitratisoma sp. DHT3]QDX80419.1 DUF4845 domain-containing protein [Denitratisoma sp. DHT3]
MRGSKFQRGLTLGGMLMGCVVIGLVAMLGMKVTPDVLEYFAIQKTIKAMVQDPALKDAGVSDVRKSFDKRAPIDRIESIKGEDLDISKEGGQIVITFAYPKKISLFGKVSLLIDFEGTSAAQ